MKQSAVEFLEEKLNEIKSSSTNMNGTIKFLETEFKELFKQAEEIEKQQIINFVNWCNSEDTKDLILDLILVGELNKKPTTKELLEIYKNK